MVIGVDIRAPCPDCGESVVLRSGVRLGKVVTCPHCDAELEVVETEPLELDWVYEDEYEDDDDDDDW